MTEKKIKFTSTIFDGNETYTTNFYSAGTLHFDENSNITQVDFAEPTDDDLTLETSLTITENEVQITREGHISMMQKFILGEEVCGTYETEFGELATMSVTKALEVDCTVENGEIYLAYDFYLNEEKVSVIQLLIEY